MNAFTTAFDGARRRFAVGTWLAFALLLRGFVPEAGGETIIAPLSTVPSKPGDSPNFVAVGSGFLFSDLRKGDDRPTVIAKLKKAGFREIYEEKEKALVRCACKVNGFRYDLACKFDDKGGLALCLVEGRKGWQFSFYDETLEPQWSNLRQVLTAKYGAKRTTRALPALEEVPMNDPGGYVTDTWDLPDRLVVLTVQAFQVKDCCTKRLVDYSCCTLLIQPK